MAWSKSSMTIIRVLRRVVVRGEKDLRRKSRAFEHKHNTRCRYRKLQGQTPEMALKLKQCQVRIRFPVSLEAPPYPLPKPEKGRYHLVRFIRSDGRLDIFRRAIPSALGGRLRARGGEH